MMTDLECVLLREEGGMLIAISIPLLICHVSIICDMSYSITIYYLLFFSTANTCAMDLCHFGILLSDHSSVCIESVLTYVQ